VNNINPLQLDGENIVPVIKCPQWPHEKTLSHNAMSFLKFSAFIIIHLFFTAFVEEA
jgi:hypothetical protein